MMIEQLKAWVLSRIYPLVQAGKVTRVGTRGDDQVDGPVEGVPTPARRMWPWGLRSVPPVGSAFVGVAVGGSSANLVMVGAETTKRTSAGLEYTYGPTDVVEGETVLYAKSGQVIRLHDDGSITVIPKSGQKVKLGDSDDANLDAVALFTRLQVDFNNFVNRYNAHQHLAGTLIAPMGGGAVTGATATTLSNAQQLSNAVGSSNVVAKK